jgi:hypothetical protein
MFLFILIANYYKRRQRINLRIYKVLIHFFIDLLTDRSLYSVQAS